MKVVIPGQALPKENGWKRFGGKSLVVSVAVHLLFFGVATVFVVHRYQAKRKMTFEAGQSDPSPSMRALEHKVQVKRQQGGMSAPAMSKRITTSGLAAVALPDMPAMPATDLVPNAMAGLGGTGTGFGTGGRGSGFGGGDGGFGGSVPTFGFREPAGGGSLEGYLYDIKQTHDKKPTDVDEKEYIKVVRNFVNGGWKEDDLKKYYKSPKPLYAVQFYIPHMDADEAPKAYGVQKEVKPSRWIALYRGRVSPAETGRYRFVGYADDVLLVRVNRRLVLDGSYADGYSPDHKPMDEKVANGKLCAGDWFNATRETPFEIEVLIGERPGGSFCAFLLWEKSGVDYPKKGDNKERPLFRLLKAAAPRADKGSPPVDGNAPPWKGFKQGEHLLPGVLPETGI